MPRKVALSGLIGGGNAHRPPFFGTGGVRTAQQIAWEFMAQSREYLYTPQLWQRLDGYSAYDEVAVSERIQRWHPVNQSLYTSYKIDDAGHASRRQGGSGSTRFSATEGRYPFLDERVVEFCAGLAPHYKLRWMDGQVSASPRRRPRAAAAHRQARQDHVPRQPGPRFRRAGAAALGGSVAQSRNR